MVVVGAITATTRGSSSHAGAASTKIAIGGQVVVYDVDLAIGHCKARARGANDDVTQGSEVTIYNASATVVGTTTLGPPTPSGTSLTNEGCTYSYVASVPPSAFYSVQVGSHNKITVTASKARASDASLSFDAN
jgi:hypothetical protein